MVLAFWVLAGENWWVQGHSDPNRELLDAMALCRQLVAEGSVEAFLADHRRELFPDEMFEDLFPSGRGRPSVPADVVASVMVLQALEGRSDRNAARALRDRISWKVACGLALDDEGFDYSVLTYWRTRAKTACGRSPRKWPLIGLSLSSTHNLVTCINPARNIAMASRPMLPSSPTPV
jgi:hypothetical protein